VREQARALTGWSLGGLPGLPRGGRQGSFIFQTMMHEPGPRRVLGRSYEQDGEAKALAILHDLASLPATARHIAGKLARHFVSDTPPPALVPRLAATFARSGGDLPSVYRALINSPEAWNSELAKFKTPWDWTLSSMRGLGLREVGNRQFAPLLVQLGQPVWRPGSPAGYDDVAESWAAPDMLMRRVEFAQRFATQVDSSVDARRLGPQLLPGGPGEALRGCGRMELVDVGRDDHVVRTEHGSDLSFPIPCSGPWRDHRLEDSPDPPSWVVKRDTSFDGGWMRSWTRLNRVPGPRTRPPRRQG
jgi:hypothetical protein